MIPGLMFPAVLQHSISVTWDKLTYIVFLLRDFYIKAPLEMQTLNITMVFCSCMLEVL